MGFQTREVLSFFFKTFQTKYQLKCNYNFYPIFFVIASKFVNYIMKLMYQAFLKDEIDT
jgi:hypothetical protein